MVQVHLHIGGTATIQAGAERSSSHSVGSPPPQHCTDDPNDQKRNEGNEDGKQRAHEKMVGDVSDEIIRLGEFHRVDDGLDGHSQKSITG